MNYFKNQDEYMRTYLVSAKKRKKQYPLLAFLF